VIVGAIGALVVLAAAGVVAMNSGVLIGQSSSATPTLAFVPLRDVDAASATLTPSEAGGLVSNAKRCTVPLASMVIYKGSAEVGTTLRIRAGNYVSPYFNVTEGMQRIAVPYPAAYEAGAGTLVVEGSARGAILGLTPTKVLVGLPGSQSIPVVWRPEKPC
jgi:hypothetical protein